MRQGIRALGALTVLVPVTLAAQTRPFEGAITIRMNPAASAASAGAPGAAPMPPQTFEYLVRGGRLRMNLTGGPGGGMSVIASPQEKKLYMLVPSQGAYMEMPLAAAAGSSEAAMTAAKGTKVERTGRMETVAGYRCEHLLVTPARGPATDLCVTTELGRYIDPLQGMRPAAAPAWQQALADGFPLKVMLPNGAVVMEVTAVERKRLDHVLFAVPASYIKMAAPAMRPPSR